MTDQLLSRIERHLNQACWLLLLIFGTLVTLAIIVASK